MNPSNFAILVRTNAQAAALECALLARKIPVRVAGAEGGVWSTSMGREVLAYLRAAEGTAHEDLTRVANKPLRFIRRDVVTQAVAATKGGRNDASVISALFQMRDRAADRLATDLQVLSTKTWEARCSAVADLLITDLQERAAAEKGNAKSADADDDREATYHALAEAAAGVGSVKAIDAQIAAMKKVTDETPAVTISSIHRAKGQEYEVVYVAGVAEGILPHKKAEDTEEERRLFYVAATRAKTSLVLSTGGEASEFLGAPSDPQGGLRFSPEDLAEARQQGALDSSDVASREAAHASPAAYADRGITAMFGGPTVAASVTCPAPRVEASPSPSPASPAGAVAKDLVSQDIEAALSAARTLADAATAREPRATTGDGGRFVDVKLDDMTVLLAGFTGLTGFSPTLGEERGQRTFTFSGPRGTTIKVYSTIAPGATVARGCGEDSIRVVALDGKTGKPVLPKEAWVARTRGWRGSLLDRIESVIEALYARPECPKCSSLTACRTRKSDGATFNGCVRYPECSGVAA